MRVLSAPGPAFFSMQRIRSRLGEIVAADFPVWVNQSFTVKKYTVKILFPATKVVYFKSRKSQYLR